MARDPFPPHRSGDDLDDVVERMGGTSSRQRLETCTVCQRPVWISVLHAHAACLEGLGVPSDHLGHVVDPPDRPPSVIGLVYAGIRVDSHVSQVTDRAAAEADRAAKEMIASMPLCVTCHRPMVVGQRGTHRSCVAPIETGGTL